MTERVEVADVFAEDAYFYGNVLHTPQTPVLAALQ